MMMRVARRVKDVSFDGSTTTRLLHSDGTSEVTRRISVQAWILLISGVLVLLETIVERRLGGFSTSSDLSNF